MESFLQYIQTFIMANPEHTWLTVVLVKVVGSVLFFPGAPTTLLAGSLLGKVNGITATLVGSYIGSSLTFLISRYLFRDWVEKKFLPKYPKIKEYEKLLFTDGFKTVLFLRLVPLFPFNALNYILGVTRVTFKEYFLGTLIGIIPGTIVYVYLGDSIAMFNLIQILISLVLLFVLAYVVKFWKLKK
jgi:uncharacterized membrane protein YdjX (TVP38/TMEM64 family)